MATVVFYVLWLRREGPRVQRTFLLLWTLSPCLLLYALMARSYTMQLTLALLAIYAAVRWAEQLRGFVAFSLSCAALLYTHYLPGLAILASTSLALLLRRGPSIRTRTGAVAASTTVVILLYLPWLATMHSAVGNWVSSSGYRVGGLLADQIVRIGYWVVLSALARHFPRRAFCSAVLWRQ